MFKSLKEQRDRMFGPGPSDAPDPPPNDHGQDLTTIMDRSQRGDLTVLVAEITQHMRDSIVQNFQSTAAEKNDNPPTDQPAPEKDGGAASLSSPPTDTPKETAPAPAPADNQKPQETASKAQYEKAAASTLSCFDDWRDTVLLRIGEVVNRDGENEGQQNGTIQAELESKELPLNEDENSLKKLHEIYPPVETALVQLPKATKLLILHSLLLLLLSLEHYNAYSRVLMMYVVSSLKLDINILNDDEVKVARGLLDTALQLSSNPEAKDQVKKSDSSKKWKVGIASVAGAAIIGLTGGLAAPLVAAGLGTVMGGLGLGATAAAGYLGALAGSGVIVGGLFGAYGGRMTGKMMHKYAREVEDFAFIPIRGSRNRSEDEREAAREDHRLRVTIGISGWITEEENFVIPWRVIGADSEVFGLRWELVSLLNLGNAINALVTSAAWSVASSTLARTMFAQLMSAVVLPLGILKVASVADNPFSVAKARADKAGEVLADALINKVQGERSVTLVGYSLGSRVIFSCLQSLAKRRAYGLVESAIFMGSPTPSNTEHWRRMRSVVSGRVVNVFSSNDSVLALLYRTSSLQLGVAGLQAVEGLPGVENLDMSEMISGHLRYQHLIGRILNEVGLESIDSQEMTRQEAALEALDRKREEERIQNEREAGVDHDKAAREDLENGKGLDEHEKLQKQVDERTQERLLPRAAEKLRLHRKRPTPPPVYPGT
ncbi:hypothetical protein AWENTII_005496 [Aspergillus wentii]|nr:hypothetical protein MW887_000582 [Aspergillus wentii]